MKTLVSLSLVFLVFFSCKTRTEQPPAVVWEPYDETAELEALADNENPRLQFKLLNSKFADKNEIWAPFEEVLRKFTEERYQELKPLILEQDIPYLQQLVSEGKLSYTDLALFYLYRIRKTESDNQGFLNAVISLNPEVVAQAAKLDEERPKDLGPYSIYGMPILLKDNINTEGMPTTAGAIVLAENRTGDAFIVDKLKQANALILGKVNLSEWAYFFCEGCPFGYSAVGGQTLNPYGRKIFETGGSSSGSGVAVAANYAVAAVGTETSGSILSPSSKNSVVGLKPTVGLLSRTGIVPISSTLDTPGPMTKSIIDNAILLSALTGKDAEDEASVASTEDYLRGLESATFEGRRLGVIKRLLEDTLYARTVERMEALGAEMVVFEAPEVNLAGFGTLLTADMKTDLPGYLQKHAGPEVEVLNIEEIIAYNLEDTLLRIPYGQNLFEGIVQGSTTPEELKEIKETLQANGIQFFIQPMQAHQLDAVLSIDNYHAAYAAVAKFPALAVPMGLHRDGEPSNITFIARPFHEKLLLELGAALEKEKNNRSIPKDYR